MRFGPGGLVEVLLQLPVFHSEWVLYLLLLLSLLSVAVMIERALFYWKRRVDTDLIGERFAQLLSRGDFRGAADLLQEHDALQTTVVLAGLRAYEMGPEAVEDLIVASLGKEKARYERRLTFLATLASNAPYLGLFGTVLGIVRSFRDLATHSSDATSAVMAGIAESLMATAVGLLVAIPAVVAFNAFKAKVKHAVTDGQGLARVLLSQLKAVEPLRDAAE